MKNIFKVLIIIAIIAVVGFSIASCEEREPWLKTTITTTTLPNGTVETAYSQTLTATGSDKPYRWKLVYDYNKRLPSGLSLNEDGVISGTPTDLGKYTFIVGVNYGSDSKELSITIDNASRTYLDFTYITNNDYGYNPSYNYAYTITKYNGAGVSVTIPAQINGKPVTRIDNIAFSDCISLTVVTIPNSVKQIGYGAFSNCTSLNSVTIPNSVTSIGNNAFSNCTSLTGIIIPNNVTSIGSYAFNGCTNLTSVRFERYYSSPSSWSSVNSYNTYSFDTETFINSVNTTSLNTAYKDGGIGTYTRPNKTSTTWTKQSE